MVRLWSLPSRDQQQEQDEDPTQFQDHSSCFLDNLVDFDPVEEWLVDPDQSPMPDSDLLKESVGFGSANVDLGHQDLFLDSSIDEKMEKVCLSEVVEATIGDEIVKEVKIEEVSEVCTVSDPIKVGNESDEEESSKELQEEEESGDSSSDGSSFDSSSSVEEVESSSSSDEEKDGDGDEKPAEIEEGEIHDDDLDEVLFGSDGEEDVPSRKSRHEPEVLPPVPPVEVSLEPHHHTLPVGFVSSILGDRVIVEGSEKHSPLNEGSILWITDTRSLLGRVDEIFGPVKNPYYIVRYNSDKEVPPGITVGVAVSFVTEFADHILNQTELHQKVYDADDESADEVQFSDDEKEAEYKRSLKQKKKREKEPGKYHEPGFGSKKNNYSKVSARVHKDEQPHKLHAPQPGMNSAPCFAPSSTIAPTFPLQSQQALHNSSQNFNNLGFPPQPQQQQPMPQAFDVSSQNFNNIGLPHQPQQQQPMLQTFHSPSQNFNNTGFPPQPQQEQSMCMQGEFPLQAQHMMMMMMQGGGFPPYNQPIALQGNSGFPMNWQFGAQNHQLLNSFAGGMMPPFMQPQPQFGLNGGPLCGNLPWPVGVANPSSFIGQCGFGRNNTFGFGNVKPSQGASASSNQQCDGQQAVASVNQGEVRPPSMQFNRGRSSFRGRRPYQRGGRQFSGGRGGNRQNG